MQLPHWVLIHHSPADLRVELGLCSCDFPQYYHPAGQVWDPSAA